MRLVTFGGEGRYSFRFDGITGRRGRPRVCSVEHVTMASRGRHGRRLEKREGRDQERNDRTLFAHDSMP